jgi:hypothetical protein
MVGIGHAESEREERFPEVGEHASQCPAGGRHLHRCTEREEGQIEFYRAQPDRAESLAATQPARWRVVVAVEDRVDGRPVMSPADGQRTAVAEVAARPRWWPAVGSVRPRRARPGRPAPTM